MTDSRSPTRQVSDAEARSILARAAALDSREGDHLTVADLRQAALDAGIDSTALDRALADKPGTRWQRLGAKVVRPALAMAAGVGLGWLAVWTDSLGFGPEFAAAVFGPSAAFALLRSLHHRWVRTPRRFVEEAILAFGCFTLVATFLAGAQATLPALGWSAACVATGYMVAGIDIRLRRSRSTEQKSQFPLDA